MHDRPLSATSWKEFGIIVLDYLVVVPCVQIQWHFLYTCNLNYVLSPLHSRLRRTYPSRNTRSDGDWLDLFNKHHGIALLWVLPTLIRNCCVTVTIAFMLVDPIFSVIIVAVGPRRDVLVSCSYIETTPPIPFSFSFPTSACLSSSASAFPIVLSALSFENKNC